MRRIPIIIQSVILVISNLLLGEFDEALQGRYAEVAKSARESGDEELEAKCVRFAGAHLLWRTAGRGEKLYETAIEKAKAVGSLEFRVRGTIGLCRYLIGERNAPEAGKAIDRLVEFAQESKSDRTRYEAEFLTGEMLRIMGQSESALPHYHECVTYASRQRQFELALKCHVRLYETDPDSRDKRLTISSSRLMTSYYKRRIDIPETDEFPLFPVLPRDNEASCRNHACGIDPIDCCSNPQFSTNKNWCSKLLFKNQAP